MQLTGPLFLFFFLPLSLLLVLPAPARLRPLALALISAVWYVAAYFTNPFGLLHIALILLLAYAGAQLAGGLHKRTGLVLGAILPLALLLGARILAEIGIKGYTYPMGLTFVTLAAISVTVDCYRDITPAPRATVTAAFVLFFPTLSFGPIVKYRDFLSILRNNSPSFPLFSKGVQLYMLGFCKRIAVAAVLMRVIRDILSLNAGGLPLSFVLLLLLMAFILLAFFFSGTSDMARGIAAMYGIALPRAQGKLLRCTSPTRYLEALLLSLGSYVREYVTPPLCARLPRRNGKMLIAALTLVITVFFFRLHLAMLVVALPFFFFSLYAANKDRTHLIPRHPIMRVAGALTVAVIGATFALSLLLEDPLDVFYLFANARVLHSSYNFYYLLTTVSGLRYVMVLLTALVLLLPLSFITPYLYRRAAPKLRRVLRTAATALLFTCFIFTLIYFMPQFPHYADKLLADLFI